MAKQQMTGGEAIIQSVVENGTDTIFGIPGAQIYPLFDGIYKTDSLNLVVPRHEQTAAYMAMGYAKSSGKTGVFSVVPGPGILNASAAMVTAMGACAPIVGLTGQVPSSFMGKGRGHLHEMRDQAGTLKSIIKDAVHIADAADTSDLVNGAFQAAKNGCPGPVTVDMCWDVMASPHELEIKAPAQEDTQPEINLDEIQAAVELLKSAKKPMIMCGSGAQHAAEEVLAFAELFNAPVTAFRMGRGVVPEDHALYLPPAGARELWDDVDVVIGIGSRLEMPYMFWGHYLKNEKPDSGKKILRIDIDPEQMKILTPDVGVIGDSATVCRLLVDKLTSVVSPNKDRLDDIAAAKGVFARAIQKLEPQLQYLSVIRDVLPRDGFYVTEISQMGFSAYTGALPVYQPRTFVDCGYQGTLGFGFPTALGVKVANPDKAVVSVCGDGGFMFGVQELITASEHNIGLVTIVFNNQAYGNVRRDQQLGYGSRFSGSELTTPDFVKLAESCHVAGYRVATPQELKPVLERCINDNKPALIEVTIERGSEASPWEFINLAQRVAVES